MWGANRSRPKRARDRCAPAGRLTELDEQSPLRVEVDRVLPLERAADAHGLGESGLTRGKIVLRVQR